MNIDPLIAFYVIVIIGAPLVYLLALPSIEANKKHRK